MPIATNLDVAVVQQALMDLRPCPEKRHKITKIKAGWYMISAVTFFFTDLKKGTMSFREICWRSGVDVNRARRHIWSGLDPKVSEVLRGRLSGIIAITDDMLAA